VGIERGFAADWAELLEGVECNGAAKTDTVAVNRNTVLVNKKYFRP